MKRFTVLTGTRTADFVVHAQGCADVKLTLKRTHCNDYDIMGEDVEAAIAADVADYEAQDQGWSRSDYHVMPCCRR